MFGIGTTELIIILLVALIVLGPTQLPGIARSLGKALGEFRRVTTDVQRTLNLEAAKIEEDEREKKKTAEKAKKTQASKASAEEPHPTAQSSSKPEPSLPPSSAATPAPPSTGGEDGIPPLEDADSNPYVTVQGEASTDEHHPQPMTSHAPSQESSATTHASSSFVEKRTPSGEEHEMTPDPSESPHSKDQA